MRKEFLQNREIPGGYGKAFNTSLGRYCEKKCENPTPEDSFGIEHN